MDKKAAVSFWEDWVEILSFLLLVAGFLLSLRVTSAVISYIVILIAGMMGGRLLYKYKFHLKFTWILVIFGFLIGFVLGSSYGDRRIIILLFIIGNAISYYLHDQGYLTSAEY